jgi:Flp pilus assembly protein TadD
VTARPQSITDTLREAYRRHMSGQAEEAERLCRRVLASAPQNTDALNLRSVIEQERGRYEPALGLLERAISLKPSVAIYHANRGRTLTELWRLDEAVAAYREALRLNPSLNDVYNGLAIALRSASRLEEAESYAREALRRVPTDDSLHSNLGCVLMDMGRPAEAEASFRAALRLRANNLEARRNLAMALLLRGDLQVGLRDYEVRLQLRPRKFRQAQWEGEPLGGRTLLVHHEQGFGDSLQFCRYVPLAAQSGRIIVEVPRELSRLFARLDGVAELVIAGEPLPDFDLHCPMMSLPSAFNTGLEDVPASVPYLTADPEDVAMWKARVASLPGLRVGLVWAGRATMPEVDRKRSIAPENLGALGEVQGVSFISLQKDAAAPAARAPFTIHDWMSEIGDFADTAALIEALDLVISVDTSVVHLAGALGKPVWMLNRFETCWRWLLDRQDSPWYPSLRMFRQKRAGDWNDVIERVQAELRALARSRTELH